MLDWTFITSEAGKWLLSGVATGVVTIAGGAIPFIYKVGADRAREWEKQYKASRAEVDTSRGEIRALRSEIEILRNKPQDLFKEYLATIEGMFTDKIKSLQDEALALQERLRQREAQLRELIESQSHDQLRFDALEESKKKLEDKLQAYSAVIQQLLHRQETAGVVIQMITSENLIVADLPLLEDTLRQRLAAIDASPMPKTRALAGRRLTERNATIAKAEREARDRSKARDEKEAIQKGRLAKPLPNDPSPSKR